MLPSKNRLTKRKDFGAILKKGKSLKEDFLVLKMMRNNLLQSRFGFVVGTKISKKAALRNQLKRRLRELVKTRMDKIKKGNDIIFIAQPGLEKRDFWELEEIIDKIFQRIGLIKNLRK